MVKTTQKKNPKKKTSLSDGQPARQKRASSKRDAVFASLTPASVKQLAHRYETMAEAEAGERLTFELKAAFVRKPSLGKVWERAQLLKKLALFGAAHYDLDQIEVALGLEQGQLQKIFDTDTDAVEIFNKARIEHLMELSKVNDELMKAGKIPVSSVKAQMALLKREIAARSEDCEHLSLATMTQLFGVSRQAVHEWVTKYACPKNADGKTYNLFKIIPWFEKFTVEKINRQPGKFSMQAEDPVKIERARRIKLDVEERLGLLWSREEVLAGLLVRAQAFRSLVERKGSDLPVLCANLPADKVRQQLEIFFAELRGVMTEIPAEIRNQKASEGVWPAFLELMKRAAGESESDAVNG